jgi:hypothetical protein
MFIERRIRRNWGNLVWHLSEDERNGQETRRTLGMLHDIHDNSLLDLFLSMAIPIIIYNISSLFTL